MNRSFLRFGVRLLLVSTVITLASTGRAVDIGVSRRDVTPPEPIRLTGYAVRKSSHVGVEQRLWAKALAIGSDREGAAVLISLDNCGIAEETWREIRRRLEKSARLRPDRIVIASSHTHSAPATTHWAPNIFVQDLTPEEQGAIDRYTEALIGHLEQVALEALRNRHPGRLSWSSGTASFAANRRTAGGPVDRSLPVLKAEGTDGRLLALVANYACHCTTIGGEFNNVCGDWAGFAQEAIEREAPGAVAMVTIGCGADANPSPRGGTDHGVALARRHGDEIGAEVKRLLGMTFVPLTSRLRSSAKEIQLPFGPHFSRDQWLQRSTNSGIVGYHARKWLARVERGEKVPDSLYYPITTWNFGTDLAMVFLPGEVVVDYGLRLKTELDREHLWVTGYANYVPCYIPSRRILAEGGYEAEDSLWYYDRPARLSTNAEDLIITTVRGLVPKTYRRDPKRVELPPAKSPQESLRALRTRAGFEVELVANEPLIESPVAIDWDARGRLWVCEMYDYPAGIHPPADVGRKYGEPLKEPPGGFTPGGRIKILTDRDGDGRYDKATLFLDHIPFPTGVMPWGKGALICAAPDILYAEDLDGDGRADVVRTNVTGFARHNYQARVNGFTWGLDGWLHGSSGLFGGKVKSLQTGREIDLSGRDFRYRPDTGELEPVSGISQYGRVRDDFDSWFGNDNSTWLWHYPLPDYYLRRNPYISFAEPRVLVSGGQEANRLFPASRTLTRFNDPQMANIVTSACGPAMYRDTLLGNEYYGNAFVCEPVHNLVRRLVLDPDGVSYKGRRGVGEERTEFLASADNWFRPVQARTGPDGALYVVDMYRFVVEHPRWIPPERLRQLDPRAGAELGRIYRIFPRGKPPGRITRLDKLNADDLVHALVVGNGTTRDLAHQTLIQAYTAGKPSLRSDIAESIGRLVNQPCAPAAHIQLLAAMRDLNLLGDGVIRRALNDAEAGVRRFALGLAEGRPGLIDDFTAFVMQKRNDDERTLFQFWLAASGFRSNDVSKLMAGVPFPSGDRSLETAWLLAARQAPLDAFEAGQKTPKAARIFTSLLAMMLGDGRVDDVGVVLTRMLGSAGNGFGSSLSLQLQAELLDHPEMIEALSKSPDTSVRRVVTQLDDGATSERVVQQLVSGELNTIAPDAIPSVIRILGHRAQGSATNQVRLMELFGLELDSAARQELRKAVSRLRGEEFPREAIKRWSGFGPSIRRDLLELMLTKETWAETVLGGVEDGMIQGAELTLVQRQRLRSHGARGIRTRAEKVFSSTSTDRGEIVARYHDVGSLAAAIDRGSELFAKNCAQCHAFRGQGNEVGPNLAEFAGKSPADFVVAIMAPNAAINPNYLAYGIETRDGRSLSGIVRGETASSLTLVQAGGVRETIVRRDIAEIRASSLSLMPEGLEQALAPQDLADLIAWLKAGTPALFGSGSAADVSKARATFVNAGANGCAEVLTAFETLPYPGWLGRLPMAYCRQNAGQNRFVWRSDALPATVGSSHTFRIAVGMGFASQPAGKFALKVNGRPLLAFDVSLTDRSWIGDDGRARMSYSVMEANSEDSNGVLAIEVPGEMLKAPEAAVFEVTGSASGSQRWFGIYQLPASMAGGKR